MKERSKFRRHQTAYEAPEIEGEFLNDSADAMLSVSDSLGNLSQTLPHEIDSHMLEEYNEDVEPVRVHSRESLARAGKRPAVSRNSSVYMSARSLLDQKKAKSRPERIEGSQALRDGQVRKILKEPYVLLLCGLALGIVLGRNLRRV